ncbi:MAG: hypothetical protein M1817_004759 [Caeruleum heppii]|nr:MAG: hypothetical protein M1817_004759 [Caeruleum heppii]
MVLFGSKRAKDTWRAAIGRKKQEQEAVAPLPYTGTESEHHAIISASLPRRPAVVLARHQEEYYSLTDGPHPPECSPSGLNPTSVGVAPSHPLFQRRKSVSKLNNLGGSLRRLCSHASTSLRLQEARPAASVPKYADLPAEVEAARPTTSWHRRASSFAHRSTRASITSPGPRHTSSTDQLSRCYRSQHTATYNQLAGSAARASCRAAATAQSEKHGHHRLWVLKRESKGERDAESGIGIELRRSVDGPILENNVDCSIVRKDPLTYLPPELTAYIFSFLDHASLAKSERVSWAWCRAGRSHHVWRDVFRNEHNGPWTLTPSAPLPFDTTGRGMGKQVPDQDWKRMFRVRKRLRKHWDTGQLSAAWVEGHTDSVYCAQFDEDKFITGSRDRTIRVWDVRTYQTIKVLGPPDVVKASTAAATAAQNTTSHNGVITVHGSFATATGLASAETHPDLSFTRSTLSMYHDASILCLQFDSQILVTGSSDTTCIVWSIEDDYRPIRRLSHHTAGVLDVCFDERRIVSCSKDTTLCVWDRTTGTMLQRLHGHKGPVNAVQMRGNLVVSASGDALIKLWNLDSGKCVREFAGQTRGLACVQFSEDSRWIVSGGNDMIIRIWDASTGECVRQLEGHRSLVRALHLDSDNGRIISGSYDSSVKVFDFETGTLLIDFPKWTSSWILCTKADYRRIIATSQCGRTYVMDFGADIKGIERLEASPQSYELEHCPIRGWPRIIRL